MVITENDNDCDRSRASAHGDEAREKVGSQGTLAQVCEKKKIISKFHLNFFYSFLTYFFKVLKR